MHPGLSALKIRFCSKGIERSRCLSDEVRLGRQALLLKIGLGHRVMQ